MSALVISNQAKLPKTAALLRRGRDEYVTLDTVRPMFLVILSEYLPLCDKLALGLRKSGKELSGAGPLASRFYNSPTRK